MEEEKRNPVTGPVFIEGADVGDVLCVHIQQIKVAEKGIVALRPGAGILGRDVRQPAVRVVSISGDQATIEEGVSVPVRPMVGVIGVAARHGEISTRYPGRHGGNMDTPDITVGARVYLPVQVKGALLGIGDVKACMGDGQTSGTGVEVAAEVTVRVDTLPGGRFAWPRIETNQAYITIASASSADQASRIAVMEMVRWLEQDKGLNFETAYMLVGTSGDLRISQWGNPLVTARVVFPRAVMNRLPQRFRNESRPVVMETTAPPYKKTDTGENAPEESGKTDKADGRTVPETSVDAGTQETPATPEDRSAASRSRRRRRRPRRADRKTASQTKPERSNEPEAGQPDIAPGRAEPPETVAESAGSPGEKKSSQTGGFRRRRHRRRAGAAPKTGEAGSPAASEERDDAAARMQDKAQEETGQDQEKGTPKPPSRRRPRRRRPGRGSTSDEPSGEG